MDDPIMLADHAMVSGFGQLSVLKQSCLTNQLPWSRSSIPPRPLEEGPSGRPYSKPPLSPLSLSPSISLGRDGASDVHDSGSLQSAPESTDGSSRPQPSTDGPESKLSSPGYSRFRPCPSGPQLDCSRLPRWSTPDSTSPASVPQTALGGRAQLPVSNSLSHAYVLWLPFLYEAMHGSADDTELGSGSTTSNTVSSQLYDRLSTPSSVPTTISSQPCPSSLPNPDHPPLAHLLSLPVPRLCAFRLSFFQHQSMTAPS